MRHVGSLILAVLALLVARPAAATTVVRQSVDSLARGSEIVVRGRVEELRGHVERGGRPFRVARVRVDESVAGRAPAVVWVRLAGGALADGRVGLVPGVPDLAVGDELVLFLERVPRAASERAVTEPAAEYRAGRGIAAPHPGPAPPEQWIPLSLAVGVYHVLDAPAGAVVVQDAEAGRTRRAGSAPTGGDAPGRMPLAQLVGAVRSARGPATP